MQSLFIQPSLTFEKTAAEVVLPDDPNSWPEELLQELFKQVPYIADFEPQVVMEKVNPEQGFGFGHVLVQNKTEVQQGTSEEGLQAAGVKQARIPIVIKDRKLFPFDVVLTQNSEVLPLTESRLRQAIFRPSAFDITGRTPGDHSLIGQLYPPYRQNYGFGGGGAVMSAGGLGKEASMLSAILPTIEVRDATAFFHRIAEDKNLEAAYVKNAAAALPSLKKLAEFEPQGVPNVEPVPTVVQLRKEASGYSLKTASHKFWAPKVAHLSRREALTRLGEKVVLAADLSGSATMALGAETAEPEEMKPTEADEFELVSRSGMYKVQDEKGLSLTGIVLTNLVDTDGSSLPISVFTNGSAQAVQGDIAGARVGDLSSLPAGEVQGYGLFYTMAPNGKVKATVPLRVQGSAGMMGGPTTLSGETFDGRPVAVSQQPNLADLVGYGDQMLIPASWKWLPLLGQEVHLAEETELMGKQADAQRTLASVELRGDGSAFSVSGFAVDKVAAEDRQFLSVDETVFLLSALGVSPDYAMQKMGEAARGHAPTRVRVGRYLKTAEAAVDELHKQVMVDVEKRASIVSELRRDLVKEAAVIPDPTAVDTVLSLSFLNPENLGIFISYLPVLDDAQKKMCEILLGARLGMREIPTSALERAVKALEEVIEGLRILAFQQV